MFQIPDLSKMTAEEIAKIDFAAVASLCGLSAEHVPAAVRFRPRPDQPERHDQQTAFLNCQSRGVIWLLGGNGAGCASADQQVFDPVLNVSRKISEIGGPFHVWARNSKGETVVAKASRPRVYGKEGLYKVSFSNGRTIEVTLGHRVLTLAGWQEIGDIVRRAPISVSQVLNVDRKSLFDQEALKQFGDRTEEFLKSVEAKVLRNAIVSRVQEASSASDPTYSSEPVERERDPLSARTIGFLFESDEYESRSLNRPSGFQDYCSTGLHLCGAQLRYDRAVFQGFLQRQVYADARSRLMQRLDDPACKPEHSPACQSEFHHSTIHSARPVRRAGVVESASSDAYSQSSDAVDILFRNAESSTAATHQSRDDQQFPEESFRNCTTQSSLESATVSLVASSHPMGGTDSIAAHVTSIEYLRHDEYWDFSVEEHENYWMDGLWHHNTTELAMAKTARFVMQTPPPRKDTPFWIIAESYEQCMETCWKEKLFGHGHISEQDVDWSRVTWYSSKDGLPKRIPLLSPPGSPTKNWTLEFKSWNQGRGQMQARSLGGFCFVEQFPWGVFEEVLRGCREYNFPGSKFVEYTPVDPDMSGVIEEMIENGKRPSADSGIKIDSSRKYLPKDWEVFHANTECAVEAGHVDPEWFEEFFGMISEEMKDVRMKGLFASYEGVIFKSFSPFVHLMGDEMFDRLEGCWHRRGIDWGAGIENPFAAVWGARNSRRQWFIYDEYYSNDQERTTIDHLCQVYIRHDWENHPLFGQTYCDPSSPGNIRIASKLSRYAPAHIKDFALTRGINSVLEGIEHIRYLLKRGVPVTREEGYQVIEPRIFIHRNCKNLIAEIRKYRWLQSNTTTSLNPKDAKREPLKKDDHLIDALRYMVFTDDGREGQVAESIKRDSVAADLVPGSGAKGGWRGAMGKA